MKSPESAVGQCLVRASDWPFQRARIQRSREISVRTDLRFKPLISISEQSQLPWADLCTKSGKIGQRLQNSWGEISRVQPHARVRLNPGSGESTHIYGLRGWQSARDA
jgi:hypothetical protein